MNNATCPHHSDCPTICEPNEVKCPETGTDDNGCKLKQIGGDKEAKILNVGANAVNSYDNDLIWFYSKLN